MEPSKPWTPEEDALMLRLINLKRKYEARQDIIKMFHEFDKHNYENYVNPFFLEYIHKCNK